MVIGRVLKGGHWSFVIDHWEGFEERSLVIGRIVKSLLRVVGCGGKKGILVAGTGSCHWPLVES